MEGEIQRQVASNVSAYWIIPGACFGLSAVTALFMKYRDHMLKVKSNAENLETWTEANEIEELKAQIQERGKLCSLIRAELEQAFQQEEQSVEELQWLIRDIERQKELEKEALSRRCAHERYKDKLLILQKEFDWWKERARLLKEEALTVAETETLKCNAERILLEKERELMKKKRALHELRRKRWEKPFVTFHPPDIESPSTEYSSVLKFLSGSSAENSEESVRTAANSSSDVETSTTALVSLKKSSKMPSGSLKDLLRKLSGSEVRLARLNAEDGVEDEHDQPSFTEPSSGDPSTSSGSSRQERGLADTASKEIGLTRNTEVDPRAQLATEKSLAKKPREYPKKHTVEDPSWRKTPTSKNQDQGYRSSLRTSSEDRDPVVVLFQTTAQESSRSQEATFGIRTERISALMDSASDRGNKAKRPHPSILKLPNVHGGNVSKEGSHIWLDHPASQEISDDDSAIAKIGFPRKRSTKRTTFKEVGSSMKQESLLSLNLQNKDMRRRSGQSIALCDTRSKTEEVLEFREVSTRSSSKAAMLSDTNPTCVTSIPWVNDRAASSEFKFSNLDAELTRASDPSTRIPRTSNTWGSASTVETDRMLNQLELLPNLEDGSEKVMVSKDSAIRSTVHLSSARKQEKDRTPTDGLKEKGTVSEAGVIAVSKGLTPGETMTSANQECHGHSETSGYSPALASVFVDSRTALSLMPERVQAKYLVDLVQRTLEFQEHGDPPQVTEVEVGEVDEPAIDVQQNSPVMFNDREDVSSPLACQNKEESQYRMSKNALQQVEGTENLDCQEKYEDLLRFSSMEEQSGHTMMEPPALKKADVLPSTGNREKSSDFELLMKSKDETSGPVTSVDSLKVVWDSSINKDAAVLDQTAISEVPSVIRMSGCSSPDAEINRTAVASKLALKDQTGTSISSEEFKFLRSAEKLGDVSSLPSSSSYFKDVKDRWKKGTDGSRIPPSNSAETRSSSSLRSSSSSTLSSSNASLVRLE